MSRGMVGPTDSIAEKTVIDACGLTGMRAVKVPNFVDAVLAAQLFSLELLYESFECGFKDLFVKAVGVGQDECDALPRVFWLWVGLSIMVRWGWYKSVDCHP